MAQKETPPLPSFLQKEEKLNAYRDVFSPRGYMMKDRRKENENSLGECQKQIRELETNNQRLRSETDKQKQELAEISKTNETLMEKVHSAGKQKDVLNTKVQEKEALILQRNEKIKRLEREILSLSTSNHSQVEIISKQSEELEMLKFKQTVQGKQKDELNTKVQEKEALILQRNGTIKRLEKEMQSLSTSNLSQVEIISKQSKELEMLKCKQKIQVQLLCDYDVNLATAITEALAEQIGDRMNSGKLEVEIIQCMKASEVQPDLPLLLLICITSHCQRANLKILKTMHVGDNMAVVIVHLKDPHALPQEASERVLVDIMERYPSIGGMFDIAFSLEKKIYKVEMNDTNIISISNFIQRVGVRKRATLLE